MKHKDKECEFWCKYDIDKAQNKTYKIIQFNGYDNLELYACIKHLKARNKSYKTQIKNNESNIEWMNRKNKKLNIALQYNNKVLQLISKVGK